jgi:ribonuclease P protein component
LKKIETIKKNSDFQDIFKKGHSMNGKYLVVYFLPNQFDYIRFGFCVGKKIGPAVRRNRIKRLLREAVRFINLPLQANWDIVLVARTGIFSVRLQSIIMEIERILVKTDIIKNGMIKQNMNNIGAREYNRGEREDSH